MRPAAKKNVTPLPRRSETASPHAGAPSADGTGRKPLKPIGPEALKALREKIRSGEYPSDAAVRSGIEKLLRRPQ